MSEGRRNRREDESSGAYGDDEPRAEAIDKEAEQRELEAAGWKKVERQGKILWRNPVSGHLYPQGAAIPVARRQRALAEEAIEGPEEGA